MLRLFLSFILVAILSVPIVAGSQPDFTTLARQLVALVDHPRPGISGAITAVDVALVTMPCMEGDRLVYINFTQYGASGMRINSELTADGKRWRRYAEKWGLDNYKLPKEVWALYWSPVDGGQPPAFQPVTSADKAWATIMLQRAISRRQGQGDPVPKVDGLLVYAKGKRAEARTLWKQRYRDSANLEEEELPEAQVKNRVHRHVVSKPWPMVLAVGYKNLSK